ncbi:MAG: dockerin type I domain-containing protein [Fuerstiella sp.]|nr:dockerin type I domain-containing protein [Fuerstiella sp.]
MSETNIPKMTEDQLPQEVVARLCEQGASPISVPRTVDEAVLADTRSVLHDIARATRVQPARRRWTLGMVSVGSLAAALLIAVAPQWFDLNRPQQPARSVAEYTKDAAESESDRNTSSLVAAVFKRDDVDGSGSVDILDAFALARRVRRSDADLLTWDQNGDGVVNEADVKLVAMNAVML